MSGKHDRDVKRKHHHSEFRARLEPRAGGGRGVSDSLAATLRVRADQCNTKLALVAFGELAKKNTTSHLIICIKL